MSCDTYSAGSSRDLDIQLADWNARWYALARYSIVRSHFGHPKKVVRDGLSYEAANQLCGPLDAAACREVGCKPDAFGRPLHFLQLENPEETRLAFLQKTQETASSAL